MEFFPESQDPSERLDYTLPLRLDTGDVITNAVIDTVDSTTLNTVVTTLVITPITWGVISGTTHGVTFWVSGGAVGVYYLRFTINTQQGRIFQRTLRLRFEQR